jgi:predicted TIM-barrel fold metal-dependent hydrolase
VNVTPDEQDLPPIISVDDHVLEPKDLWTRWLPSRFRDAGPRVVRAPYEMKPAGRMAFRRATSGRPRSGASEPQTDFWVYEDLCMGLDTGRASAGINADAIGAEPISYDEMRPGCYDPKARLADMDINGVERSLCIPTFPRFCGQTFLEAKDKELALACVEAYNNFIVEEWCGPSGGRLLPLGLVPLWDPHLAAAEVRRNAARGVTAVGFSELPQKLGLPSFYDADRHWDPFLAACSETGTVMCLHIGSASMNIRSADDAPPVNISSLTHVTSQMALTDLLLSGVLARFGNLKVAMSESQVGWMPYQLQRIDDVWRKFRHTPVMRVAPELTEPPSSYVRGRVYGCLVEDELGVRNRGGLGIDQITFESDYPHMDGTWPNTRAYAQRVLADYTQDEVDKVIRGNAIRLFRLPETLAA